MFSFNTLIFKNPKAISFLVLINLKLCFAKFNNIVEFKNPYLKNN